ncbi:MAG: DUF732 domain-containing protein [Actinomycetota bacterium]|nr:DUF732 domain-containing protein [Actinomycetota bacterium]
MNKYVNRTAQTFALTIGATAAAALLAAPAQADPIDDAFLAALRDGGVPFSNPMDTVSLGKAVCPLLVEPGKSFAAAYSTVANNGVPPQMAAFFTGIAISMYCPQMVSSLGNGTVLDWLPLPGR